MFNYGIDDVEVVERYTGVKLWNCFDYENLDHVHLFDGDTYLGTFAEVGAAQQYGPNKDMRTVGKMKAIHEKMSKARTEKLSEALQHNLDTLADEVGVLLAGKAKKHDYERAETKMIQTFWDEGDDIVHTWTEQN